MILHVEDNQLVHMISPDPMEIWLTLQHIHQAASFATSLSLHRKFLTANKSDHQTMQAWIGQIQGLAFRMEHAKIAVTDQDKILAITMGLPPSFDNVIINFDSMSPKPSL
jgi:gag-polypeptide of LTR copia-type